MRRRELLWSAVALLAGPGSGCLDRVGTETPADATPEPLPPSGYGSLSEFDAGDPFERQRVGDPAAERHHRIVVWNDDADSRRVSLRLRDVATDATVLEAEPEFPAYGSLLVEVFRRSDYVLEVTPPGGDGRRRRLGVRSDFVDCNDSATHVAVRPDGSIRARVVSTALACDVGSASGATTSAPATDPGEPSATAAEEPSSPTPTSSPASTSR